MRCIAEQTGAVNNEHNGDLRSEEEAEETAVNRRDGDRIRPVRSHGRAENAEHDTASDDVQDGPSRVTAATFECDVCNKVCRSAAGLGSHRRVHRS